MKVKMIARGVMLGLAVMGTIGWTPTRTGEVAGALIPAETQEGEVTRYEDGYRFDQYGWIYLHIEGEPYERGYQHGYLPAPANCLGALAGQGDHGSLPLPSKKTCPERSGGWRVVYNGQTMGRAMRVATKTTIVSRAPTLT